MRHCILRASICLGAVLSVLPNRSRAVEAPIPPVPDKQPAAPFPKTPKSDPHLLVPGLTIRELPIALTSLNNVEYAEDGRLFAAGYDGRFHLLRDTDGDGLEDSVHTFSPESSANYPLGMVVVDGSPCTVFANELVRFRDTNGDGIPDKRETIIEGFDDPELVAAAYLSHRRVDSSMALAHGADGAWYVTMGNAGYNNPYWQEKFVKGQEPSGAPHYSPEKRRGCLLRISADGKVEQLNSGLRYIMSLQFNKNGDLFGTDQEGATWSPNGNPFDELLHLQPGRHYGFPPSHPQFLPGVVDEPSVWNYSPQHQSTCGFRFNTAAKGRGHFGPGFWADDAIVTGESRGNLWRTSLAKTRAGYVARTEIFARLGLLATDCAISPKGDLLVCCHTGKPDWGNGPQGEGRIFKISIGDKSAPVPVLTYALTPTESVTVFDRDLPKDAAAESTGKITVKSGRYIAAGQRFETIFPPYKVVQIQRAQPVSQLQVKAARLGSDERSLVVETAPRRLALTQTLSVGKSALGEMELAYDLAGLSAEWSGADGTEWRGWLPHPDFIAARQFTRASATHDALWQQTAKKGTLTLRTQLDLWNLLQPVTQPGSKLDYEPTPESIVITFKSDAALKLEAPECRITQVSETESRLAMEGPSANQWRGLTITLATPATALDVSYTTKRDSHIRALETQRFLMPFAKPSAPDSIAGVHPQLVGGDWKNGAALFNGKATCSACHLLRGSGFAVGPDLNNLVHRDYESVLRDIADPSAVLNPDAIGYVVTTKDGKTVAGTRTAETKEVLSIAQPGGVTVAVKKSDITKTEPLPVSLMPPGLDKLLTKEELRDLMTYLLKAQ